MHLERRSTIIMERLEVHNLPKSITKGEALNLIWLVPGVLAFDLERRDGGRPVLAVTMNDSYCSAYLQQAMTGRRYDMFDEASEPMLVKKQPETTLTTLYGTGFTRDERSSYIDTSLRFLELDGLKDVRICRRLRGGRGIVFLDFCSLQHAQAASERLRGGVELETGRLTFSLSRPH